MWRNIPRELPSQIHPVPYPQLMMLALPGQQGCNHVSFLLSLCLLPQKCYEKISSHKGYKDCNFLHSNTRPRAVPHSSGPIGCSIIRTEADSAKEVFFLRSRHKIVKQISTKMSFLLWTSPPSVPSRSWYISLASPFLTKIYNLRKKADKRTLGLSYIFNHLCRAFKTVKMHSDSVRDGWK